MLSESSSPVGLCTVQVFRLGTVSPCTSHEVSHAPAVMQVGTYSTDIVTAAAVFILSPDTLPSRGNAATPFCVHTSKGDQLRCALCNVRCLRSRLVGKLKKLCWRRFFGNRKVMLRYGMQLSILLLPLANPTIARSRAPWTTASSVHILRTSAALAAERDSSPSSSTSAPSWKHRGFPATPPFPLCGPTLCLGRARRFARLVHVSPRSGSHFLGPGRH